mmetsp:Transcript_23324/g.59676  ORF Transcript_23324/g.59676 Transcript_23324/m.59676 type:complete len:284 (+) Transcript_23324:256-1107(+)
MARPLPHIHDRGSVARLLQGTTGSHCERATSYVYSPVQLAGSCCLTCSTPCTGCGCCLGLWPAQLHAAREARVLLGARAVRGRPARQRVDLLHHLDARHHLAKHHKVAVQVRGGREHDGEMCRVGVGAGVGHGHHALPVVLERQPPRVVLERAPVHAVRVDARLVDELVDDAVKGGALEAVLAARALVAHGHHAPLPRAQLPEVLGGQRRGVREQHHAHLAHVPPPDGHSQLKQRQLRVILQLEQPRRLRLLHLAHLPVIVQRAAHPPHVWAGVALLRPDVLE